MLRPKACRCYMFQKPREAKKLHFDVIPRAVDEYLNFLEAYQRRTGRTASANRSITSMPATRRCPRPSAEGRE